LKVLAHNNAAYSFRQSHSGNLILLPFLIMKCKDFKIQSSDKIFHIKSLTFWKFTILFIFMILRFIVKYRQI
jgi:hypothetical protein